MRVGFDVSQTSEEKAGCGFFADQLVRALARIDRQNEYILYPTFYNFRSPQYSKCTRPDAPNFKMNFDGLSFKEMVTGWDQQMDDRTEWLGNPDIVHSNNFSCVKDHRAKIVFTLYDVAPLVHPEFTTEANRIVCFEGLLRASLYADHCIAISEYTKRSFLHYFPHYPEDKISVVHLGTRPTIKQIRDNVLLENLLSKFRLKKEEFWLGVGTIEPRKNYRMLIDAYSELNDPKPLVIAGGKGWLESDIGETVKAKGLEGKVKFLGYVSDDELSGLYSGCLAFVYPSHFEGFGLPVLEAMSCGAAVITSNASSLPEVGGEAALYIDPRSKDSLIMQMNALVTNEELRKELRLKSHGQAGKFSWDEAARIVLGVYKKTLNSTSWFVAK